MRECSSEHSDEHARGRAFHCGPLDSAAFRRVCSTRVLSVSTRHEAVFPPWLWRSAVILAPSRCRPPTRPEAAFGVVVAEQGKIYPAMSGHNVICVATALLETGMVPIERGSATTTFHLDLPAPSS